MTEQGGTYRPVNRSDYESIVKGMIPFCEGEELRLRSGLLLMRDRACRTRALGVDNMPASEWALLEIVEREASEAAFQGMPIEDLRQFWRLCMESVRLARKFSEHYQPNVEGEAA